MVVLKFLLIKPIIGGIKAPPETAIIIRPEISLDLSGILFTAIEKINGNRLPAPNPMRKMAINPTVGVVAITIKITLSKAIEEVIIKNTRGFIKFSKIAPKNRLIIKAVK